MEIISHVNLKDAPRGRFQSHDRKEKKIMLRFESTCESQSRIIIRYFRCLAASPGPLNPETWRIDHSACQTGSGMVSSRKKTAFHDFRMREVA